MILRYQLVFNFKREREEDFDQPFSTDPFVETVSIATLLAFFLNPSPDAVTGSYSCARPFSGDLYLILKAGLALRKGGRLSSLTFQRLAAIWDQA